MCRDRCIALQELASPAPGPLRVDFGAGGMRHRRRGGNNELIGRAVGVTGQRTPGLLDATAGLGRDAFVLADLGCRVRLCERNKVVLELLRAGLESAAASTDDWLLQTVGRMSLHAGDARALDAQALCGVEVILLDPMFPQRNKSAAVKKEMALLQRLLGEQDDADAEGLLDWALQQDVARVVVKRAARSPALGGLQPSHCIRGKAVRYDVHVRRALD